MLGLCRQEASPCPGTCLKLSTFLFSLLLSDFIDFASIIYAPSCFRFANPWSLCPCRPNPFYCLDPWVTCFFIKSCPRCAILYKCSQHCRRNVSSPSLYSPYSQLTHPPPSPYPLFGRSEPHHQITSIFPRYQNTEIIWCQRGTPVFLVIEKLETLVTEAVQTMLNDALRATMSHLRVLGDGVINQGMVDSGTFLWMEPSGVTFVALTNTIHQLSWSTLAKAIRVLQDYMTEGREWTEVTFHIYDGFNEVGAGWIDGPPQNPT